MSLEKKVVDAWYAGSAWLPLLRPLSMLYKVGVEVRQRRTPAPDPLPVPLVVIGNITVGGTGKTPLIIFLCQQLRQMGIDVGVVSRGYGATCKQLPHLVSNADSAAEVGDEPMMIFRETGVPVVIDPDRQRAARWLCEHQSVSLILSDDGLQHHRMWRAMEIVVIDAARGLGNGCLLPEGPLRESVEKLDQVDLVLANGTSEQLTSSALGQKVAGCFQLEPVSWRHVQTGKTRSLDNLPVADRYQAIAGIGNPERFFRTLSGLGIAAYPRALGDHQTIPREMLEQLASEAGLLVLMTSKDAVKCAHYAGPNCWALQVAPVFDEAFAAHMLQTFRGLVDSDFNKC